jgi:hypothetical protein
MTVDRFTEVGQFQDVSSPMFATVLDMAISAISWP